MGWIQQRDRRDRQQVLAGLQGRRVTVLGGLRIMTRYTGRLFVADKADLGWAYRLYPAVVVEDDRGAERMLPMAEVFEVTDPDTGAALGGPWR